MSLEALPADDVLIRRRDVPRYVPVAKQTLARWACEGRGPRPVILGTKLVAYRAGDLRDWIAAQQDAQKK
jgi:predicted DNA-binding transcriptional regulator AlpA